MPKSCQTIKVKLCRGSGGKFRKHTAEERVEASKRKASRKASKGKKRRTESELADEFLQRREGETREGALARKQSENRKRQKARFDDIIAKFGGPGEAPRLPDSAFKRGRSPTSRSSPKKVRRITPTLIPM